MTPKPTVAGIHHITAVASSAAENLAFYRDVLGLRLIKKTVNFDDPHTYHLYFGDADGAPGTILTFFPWESLPKGRPGAGMITAAAFAIHPQALAYWSDRLKALGIDATETQRFGRPAIGFQDPHGLPLELIGDTAPPAVKHWSGGPIHEDVSLRGFYSATATLSRIDSIHQVLTEFMGLAFVGQENDRFRYKAHGKDSPGQFYDIQVNPRSPAAQAGGGTFHHIAFRADGERSQLHWQDILRRSGLAVTDVRDRHYFKSIYYRTPGGVLFEIATDPPGFAIDEPFDRLGAGLKLPPRYEPMRIEIEQHLPDLEPHRRHPRETVKALARGVS